MAVVTALTLSISCGATEQVSPSRDNILLWELMPSPGCRLRDTHSSGPRHWVGSLRHCTHVRLRTFVLLPHVNFHFISSIIERMTNLHEFE